MLASALELLLYCIVLYCIIVAAKQEGARAAAGAAPPPRADTPTGHGKGHISNITYHISRRQDAAELRGVLEALSVVCWGLCASVSCVSVAGNRGLSACSQRHCDAHHTQVASLVLLCSIYAHPCDLRNSFHIYQCKLAMDTDRGKLESVYGIDGHYRVFSPLYTLLALAECMFDGSPSFLGSHHVGGGTTKTEEGSHIAYHISHVTYHISCRWWQGRSGGGGAHPASCVAACVLLQLVAPQRQVSHITYHIPHITLHISHVAYHIL
jgi:hypothetical protein